MVSQNKIASIVIPNYIRKVKISESIRPKYWEWDGVTIKCKSKTLLKKYIDPSHKKAVILNNGNVEPQHLLKGFYIVGFKGDIGFSVLKRANAIEETFKTLTSKQIEKETKYFMCDYNGYKLERVIANPAKVGTKKYEIINGQSLSSATINPFTIRKVFDAIKEMYYNKFKTIDVKKVTALRYLLKDAYPIMIEMEIKDTVKSAFDNSKDYIGRRWDVGNRTEPYMKTFLDFLVNGLHDIEPMIEDDDRLHVTSGNNSYFTPIEKGEVRALIFHIYKDNRTIFKKYLQ